MAVAFDTGYAGSSGIQPQSWVNGNGTSYIYFGSGQFDGQGSGHDYMGTVSSSCPDIVLLTVSSALHAPHRLRQQLRWWPQPHLLRLPPGVNGWNRINLRVNHSVSTVLTIFWSVCSIHMFVHLVHVATLRGSRRDRRSAAKFSSAALAS